MTFQQAGPIEYFSFDTLREFEITQAVFTRKGGISPEPWEALNLGGTVGDDITRVAENRRRAFDAAGRKLESLYDVYQVHGKEVVCADAPRPLHIPHLRADAILTDKPYVTLIMRFADCVPIFLYDPVRRVVGLAHAGWQGTIKKVAAAAVGAMQEKYSCRAADIWAGIGPSIGMHHYEVGPEVAARVRQAFGTTDAQSLLTISSKAAENGSSRIQFDLWVANQFVLEQAGVKHIEISGLCTACDLDHWYSHRGEGGRTGRFGALIALGC